MQMLIITCFMFYALIILLNLYMKWNDFILSPSVSELTIDLAYALTFISFVSYLFITLGVMYRFGKLRQLCTCDNLTFGIVTALFAVAAYYSMVWNTGIREAITQDFSQDCADLGQTYSEISA